MSPRKHGGQKDSSNSSNELVVTTTDSKDKSSKDTSTKDKSKNSRDTKESSNTKNSSLTKDSSFTRNSSKTKDTESYDYDDGTGIKIKYGCPIIMVSWQAIRRMILTSYVLNAICVIYAIILMVSSIHTKYLIGDYLNMVSTGDGTAIPVVLFVAGFFCLPMNLSFIYIIWHSGAKGRTINTIQFALVIFNLVMVVLILILGIFCVAYTYSSMQERLHDGILDAMQKYKKDVLAKRKIDTLQIMFQCCGSKSYSDWFDVAWFDTAFATSETNQVTRDDAPFSCCNTHSHYPCIHHDLMSVGSSYLYAPETNLSVSEHGCHSVLLRHARSVSWNAFVALLFFALLEASVGLLQRLLQTAHLELCRFERNSHWHTAWLFGCYGGRIEGKGKRKGKGKVKPRPPPIPDELMR